jgi:hypothetical protein
MDGAMKLARRKCLHLATGAAALPAISRMAKAQAYPLRPITLVVPFAPGGANDVIGRVLAKGNPTNGRGDNPNEHDALTGSTMDGRAFPAGEDRTGKKPDQQHPEMGDARAYRPRRLTRRCGIEVVECLASLARIGWWLQPSGPPEHRGGRPVLLLRHQLTTDHRVRVEPSRNRVGLACRDFALLDPFHHLEDHMLYPKLISGIVLALATLTSSAQAFDETKYPDLTGQWRRRVVPGLGGQPSHDQTKPWGFGQQAPLTPEYAKIL